MMDAALFSGYCVGNLELKVIIKIIFLQLDLHFLQMMDQGLRISHQTLHKLKSMENGRQCQKLEETEAIIPKWSWLLNDKTVLFVTIEI